MELPPGNSLEAQKNERTGQHGIRNNDQWRVCSKDIGVQRLIRVTPNVRFDAHCITGHSQLREGGVGQDRAFAAVA